jgi:hypothetical protein
MKFSVSLEFSLRALVFAAVLGPKVSLAQQQNGNNSTPLPASLLVNKAIAALGGKEALESVTSVIYHVPEYVPIYPQRRIPNIHYSFFRLRTTMENYDFYISDEANAVSGNQNVTFSYPAAGSPILQRIDRNWSPSGLYLTL